MYFSVLILNEASCYTPVVTYIYGYLILGSSRYLPLDPSGKLC